MKFDRRSVALVLALSPAIASAQGSITGTVYDSLTTHAPLAAATVSTDWTEFTIATGHIGRVRARAAARTNASGIYLLCGVPEQIGLDVHAELAGSVAGPAPARLDARLIGRIDFAISRRDGAAHEVLRSDASDTTPTRPGTASLRGVVRDDRGRPLRDVLVGVLGTQRSARTNSSGTFRIDGVPAGTRAIEARSIGWQPSTSTIDLATNAVRDTVLSLSRHAQHLSAVTVLGRGTSGRSMVNRGFDTRRRQHFGTFLTQEDVARHTAFDLTDVLAGVRGIHVEYGTSGHPTPYMRGTSGGTCQPSYFLDGMPFAVDRYSPFSDLGAMVRPEQIRAIEVYSSGMIPPQYDRSSSTGCGSVVIWTR